MAIVAQTQFHWVHKDTHSESLSNSDSGSSRDIRRFVQNQRIARRRVGELQFKFATPGAVPPSSRTASLPARAKRSGSDLGDGKALTSSSPETGSDTTRQPTNQRSDVLIQAKSTARRKKPQPRGRLPRRQSSPGVSKLSMMQSKWLPGPINLLEGSAVDPFNTTVQHMTAEADTLLKYYSAFVSSGSTPYKLQLLPGKLRGVAPIQSVIDDHMSSAFRYEYCLYALFAFTSVRLFHVMNIRLKGIKTPHFYMAQAVAKLRSRLEEIQTSEAPIDRATIGAIAQLALADWTSGDLANARIHITTLANLLGYVDIEDVRGRFMIEIIRTADFQVALEDGSLPLLSAAPSFEPMPGDRIKWFEDRVQEAADSEETGSESIASRLGREPTPPSEFLDDLHHTLDYKMGWALREMLAMDVVESGLHPIIRSMLDVTTIGKAVWRLGIASVADARYMCRWGRTQLHYLYTYGFDHAGDDPTPQSLLTNCVRLALLVVGTLCTNKLSQRTAQRVGFELFDACRHIDLTLPMPRLAWMAYLWTLVTAATVAEPSSEVRLWLVSRAADTAIQLGMTSYEELDEAMVGFLYSWTFSIQVMRGILDLVRARLTEDRTEREMP